MKSWKIALVAIVLGLIALFVFGLGRDPRHIPSPLISREATDFKAITLDNDTFQLSKQRGKVVVVNFWASWCYECRVEHPLLLEIWGRFGKRPDFAMVGVIYQDSEANARAYLEQHGGGYLQVMDPKGRIALDYGVYGVPETFFIDRKGIIRYKQFGPLTREVVEKQLVPLLETGERP